VKATGKKVTVADFVFYRISNGKITDVWSLVDLYGLMQQIGAMQKPGWVGLGRSWGSAIEENQRHCQDSISDDRTKSASPRRTIEHGSDQQYRCLQDQPGDRDNDNTGVLQGIEEGKPEPNSHPYQAGGRDPNVICVQAGHFSQQARDKQRSEPEDTEVQQGDE
jgi:hypothetical protein